MKAAYITAPGTADKIVYGDLPTPEPGPGQVLVQVEAVAVNPIDTYIRSGAVAMPLVFPFIVGCDLAGKVVKLGPNAGRFKIGDRVWGTNQGLLGRQGTFAEFAAVDEQWLYPTPAEVSDETVAATALVGITAHLGLVQFAGLESDEILFVNGGSGGVGSMVVQMAKALRRPGDHHRRQRPEAGLVPAVWRRSGDSLPAGGRRRPRAAVCPAGSQRLVGNAPRAQLRSHDRPAVRARRMILMAGRDARPVFPVGPFYLKECTLLGFVMFKATVQEQRAAADDINGWLVAGTLKPHIARTFPLSHAAEAHRLQEENTVHKAGTLAGKIVLKP